MILPTVTMLLLKHAVPEIVGIALQVLQAPSNLPHEDITVICTFLKVKCGNGCSHTVYLTLCSLTVRQQPQEMKKKKNLSLYLLFTVDYRQMDYREMTLYTGKIQRRYNFFYNLP